MYMTKAKALAAALVAVVGLTATSTRAETVRVASSVSVNEAVARLTAAVDAAGAQVFTTVNYAAGAASVGDNLRPTILVIFGSPRIGASALQTGQTLGLHLPLRVLAYEDAAGAVWMIYTDPADAALEHGIATDHPAIKKMQGALKELTAVAAGG